jgi:hypothetical protein
MLAYEGFNEFEVCLFTLLQITFLLLVDNGRITSFLSTIGLLSYGLVSRLNTREHLEYFVFPQVIEQAEEERLKS